MKPKLPRHLAQNLKYNKNKSKPFKYSLTLEVVLNEECSNEKHVHEKWIQTFSINQPYLHELPATTLPCMDHNSISGIKMSLLQENTNHEAYNLWQTAQFSPMCFIFEWRVITSRLFLPAIRCKKVLEPIS